MKKVQKLSLFILLLLLTACGPYIPPQIEGSYQSEIINGENVFVSFRKEDKLFVEYISNREVDQGTFEELEDNRYRLISDKQDFEIRLNPDNSFEIVIEKLNGDEPIELEKMSDTYSGFSTAFDDVEEYESLIDE